MNKKYEYAAYSCRHINKPVMMYGENPIKKPS